MVINCGSSRFPRLHETTINGHVLLFSAGISLLTGIVFGLAPALQGSRYNLVEHLKDAARGGTSGASGLACDPHW